MAKSGINIKIEGFENLLKDIESAGGSINKACDSALRQSAKIVENNLKTTMRQANVSNRLIEAMPQFSVEQKGNSFYGKVGYEKGIYDPNNLTDGYKVVFLNYGTPHRKKHGKVKARGFIQKAKKISKTPVKNAQEEALNKILERLKKK